MTDRPSSDVPPGSAGHGRPHILFVCTGNAARSVMGAAMMRAATDAIAVTSAGTHSISGLPMSVRTRGALDAHGVSDLAHRSTQLDADVAAGAVLLPIFEPMHVKWVRRELPQWAGRTASLSRLARDLPPGPISTLSERIAALDLASCDFEPWEEVVDPAGGDLADFVAAADVIHAQVAELASRIDG